MSLQVTFDSTGSHLTGFIDLRDRLVDRGAVFDADVLRQVPYEQLALCATGEAGVARCSLDLVRQEKRDRRRRFVDAPFELHEGTKRYVQAEGMFNDIHFERQYNKAPAWDTLSLLQQTWLLLACLHNHIDHPGPRLHRVKGLLVRAGETGILTSSQASGLTHRIVHLSVDYPGEMGSEDFRQVIGSCAEEMLKLVPAVEREVCTSELVSGYSCTSDCFQPTLSPSELR